MREANELEVHIFHGYVIKFDKKRNDRWPGPWNWLVIAPNWLRMGWFTHPELAKVWVLKREKECGL